MTSFYPMDLIAIAPELMIVLSAIVLLMIGVFRGNASTQAINMLSVLVLAGALAMLLHHVAFKAPVLGGMLVVNTFTQTIKGIILVSAVLALTITQGWLKQVEDARFEYPVLVLFSVSGMLLLVSANNLIAVYMAMELMSLALYVLAAFQRDCLRSTESGLKYFVLGSLASGLMLFGMSLVYGFAGSTDFSALRELITSTSGIDSHNGVLAMGALVGLIFMIVGFAFKVSAVPFHMWTPDVYEGAPTPVTMLFAVAPKVAAIAIFVRVMMGPFGSVPEQWQQIIVCISVLSMVIGALGGLTQNNIKRLLAYSSIGHVGYVLMGLATGTVLGIQGMVVYLSLYIVMSVGMFGCVMLMRRHGVHVEQISDLAGLSKTHPRMALAITVFLFSMAGIPPLAGFFGKFYLFLAVVKAGMVPLAIIGVVSSVIACFYYLKVVKIMYFDEPAQRLDLDAPLLTKVVIALCTVFTFAFFLAPSWLLALSLKAAEAVSF